MQVVFLLDLHGVGALLKVYGQQMVKNKMKIKDKHNHNHNHNTLTITAGEATLGYRILQPGFCEDVAGDDYHI